MLHARIAAKKSSTLLRCLATFSQSSVLSKYPIGLNLYGYVVDNVRPIPEFSLVAVHLKHERTGSEHLHLDSPNDNNNVFSIAFKTNPPDATGVPHILEHTTLCGSAKYPVRDPFFKMTNRSLSNFMNAMTGHDFTYYPFATTNAKDFENLMDVYLSSVLEPLLEYNDFIQEGWRLENETTDDINSKLILKGVVYNEMKGQNSNSAYYYYIKFLESIYPSLNNSGGDPEKIPSLHYEDLIDFHRKNYHPSNAKTFTYGNLPLIQHLKKLNEGFQSFGKRVGSLDIKKPIFTQVEGKDRTPGSMNVTVSGPSDSMSERPIEEQFQTSLTWNLGNPLDESNQYEIFKWKVFSSLLFDGHSSPFYQELIEKNVCDDFSANSGFDATTAMLSLTIGLNNCSKASVDSLEENLLTIFKEQVVPELKNPDSSYRSRIEAILHQIELNLKKHKPDFGLGLLNSIVPTWVNGLDPIKSLEVESILSKFKQDYEENGTQIFNNLLEDFVFNPEVEKFKFTMKPDENFNKKLIEREETITNEMVKTLDDEDKKMLYESGLQLSEKQKEEQDCDVLPTLTMDDIAKKGEFHPVTYTTINDRALQKRVVDTNGLAYVSALKDISYIPTKYYKYLSLFTSCLTNLAGTSQTSITDLETKILKLTGGVSFHTSVVTDPYNIKNVGLNFTLSGMALRENSSKIYELWHEILTLTKLDANDEVVLDKLTTLIKNMSQNQLNIIADRGHSYANWASNSKLVPGKYISDITSGLTQIQFVLEMNSNLEKRGRDYLVTEILPTLQEIQKLLIGESGFKYRIVGDKSIVSENEDLIQKFDDSMRTSDEKSTNELQVLVNAFNSNSLGINAGQQTLINLPFQVGYASLAKVGAEYVSKDGASLQVLSQLLSFKHLHSVIRESNGAYGGGLNYDGLGGTLNFYSYRDPNALKSIEAFKDSFTYGISNTWEPKDLQEAKMRIFQSVDAPTNVASQGSTEFHDGITDDMRQERRENFLNVNNQDLIDVVNKYLINNDQNQVTVIGDNDIFKVDETKWSIRNLKV